MRITMGMVSSQYNKNLNNSLNQLNTASNRSTSYRKFDKASEDPFSYAKATRLSREYQQNSDYQNNLGDVEDQLTVAQSAMMSVNDIVSTTSTGDTIQAITATTGADARKIIATKLRALQQAILAPANTKFGDKYIFGGSGETDAPFTVGTSGNLLYRGIDVTTGEIAAGSTLSYNDSQITLGDKQFDGYKIQVTNTGATPTVTADATSKTLTVNLAAGDNINSDVLTALKTSSSLTSTDRTVTFNLSKVAMSGDLNIAVDTGTQAAVATSTIGQAGLQKLADEQSYVDLGLGLKFNTDNTINSQSVFNSAIPGISFMGFGTSDGTSSGIPNNLYTQLGQIADQLESTNFSIDKIKPNLDNFNKQGDAVLSKITESGTKSNFLTTMKAQLITMGDSINDKIDKTAFIDPAEAYMDYTNQQYAYQAALKIGSQILQPTFLDFMS